MNSCSFRSKSSRTYGGVLAVCLNAEVEPPDHLRGAGNPTVCGISLQGGRGDARKVVAAVGAELKERFVQLHGARASAYRQSLDPTAEQVQRACRKLRRDAKRRAIGGK